MTPPPGPSSLPALVSHASVRLEPIPVMSDPVTPPVAPAPVVAEDRTVAILTYVTIIGFIIAIIIHSDKKTALGAYHLRQGLGLFLTGIVVCVPFGIPIVNLVMVVLGPPLLIGLFVLWLMGLLAAVNGQQKPMPVMGQYYQRWFADTFG